MALTEPPPPPAERAPVLLDGHATLPALFAAQCAALGPAPCHREKHLGLWRTFSWTEYWEDARAFGMALIAHGLARGDRILILSEDRREWLRADMGAQCVGVVSAGVYTTDAPSQLAYLARDTDARLLVVEGDEQFDKFRDVEAEMPSVEWVVVLDMEGLRGTSHPKMVAWSDFLEAGRAAHAAEPDRFEREIARTAPDDTAFLIYTSGTTGRPKGAMITHRNVLFTVGALARVQPIRADDALICFLPLSHILERAFTTFAAMAAGAVVNFAESPETVFSDMREVRPHIFVGVPRLWEKIHARIAIALAEATPFQRWAFERARRSRGPLRPLWDVLVLANVRRTLGLDRVRRGTTGAAPIAPAILEWFASIGVPVFEGFGMTETAGIVSLNTPEANRVGTVGRVVDGGEIRISEAGEILYRAPNVIPGYWDRPEATAEAIRDGWLHTGDLGAYEDGFLRITGRLKDVIITAGGKNVTPAEIENALKASAYIADAVVAGDRRKYLTALVMIDQETVERFAQERRVPFSTFASLCAAPEVRDLIGGVVEAVNRDFARVEQVKDFRLIDTLLTAEDEELTATMKLKRGLVEKKHAALIDAMYDDTTQGRTG